MALEANAYQVESAVGSGMNENKTHSIKTTRINTRTTRFTRLADTSHPLNPHAVTKLDSRIVGSRSHLHDFTHALVAANLSSLGGEREGFPFASSTRFFENIWSKCWYLQALSMTPMSEWQTPECVLERWLETEVMIRGIVFEKAFRVKEMRTYRLIKTSPGPGSGISSSSIFVEMEPGLSYTAALYFFGISTEPIFASNPFSKFFKWYELNVLFSVLLQTNKTRSSGKCNSIFKPRRRKKKERNLPR
jgi:hypothetical protein